MPEKSTAPALRLIVIGRVAQVTKHAGRDGDVFKHLIRTPATDPYSSPGTFEVRARRRIGSEGQEVSVECDLLGYARAYSTKDGEQVKTAEHVLQVAA